MVYFAGRFVVCLSVCHFVIVFSVLLVLRLPRLGKRELVLVLFVRLFGLCLFRFVGFLFLLGSGKSCGLWLWHSLDFSLTFFFYQKASVDSGKTIDMIFTARQLQEKCQEQNVDLYMTFVDFTKAFDTVSREGLWKIMAKFGCPAKFIAMVRQFHDGMLARVQNDGEFSDPFPVTNGVKQGCVLASILFSMMFSAMLSRMVTMVYLLGIAMMGNFST